MKEAGDFTRALPRLAPGTRVYLDGPHGNFTLRGRGGKGIVLVAGGVGIAPMLSILRSLAAARDPRPVILVYGNRHAGQIVAGPELEALRGVLDLDVRHVLSEPPSGHTGPVGQLDRATLERLLPREAHGEWLYFVCGPTPMIGAVEEALTERGVPLTQIVSERFRYDSGRRSKRERRILRALAVLVGVHLAVAAAFALR